LLAALPSAAAGDARLGQDLDGDLWPALSPSLLLPLDAAAASALPPDEVVRVEVSQTGMHSIAVTIDDQLVWSQLNSLGLAAIMAMILLMIQFRSVLAGILGMIPMSLTLLINFGVMGALGIDLDPATVLIASLVVGVGIDYTIHFMSRLLLESRRQGSPEAMLRMVLRTVGRAILINAITIIGGMLVFLFAEIVPLHSFGILLALAMVTSALTALTVLPAVLLHARPRFLRAGGATLPPVGGSASPPPQV
ncbi:MAG TPA: MMPL family transporter, partial [Myxococcota bacterium]|nr:MMPL family transporter [Myxococcota bacterium]